MANGGPDTNSSEFFVTLRDTQRLNYLHSVFGRVVRGLDVLPRIQPDDAFSVRILRVGAAAAVLLLLIPGPAVLYILNRSVSDGREAGFAAVAGLSLGNLVHALAAAAGLSAVLATSAKARRS